MTEEETKTSESETTESTIPSEEPMPRLDTPRTEPVKVKFIEKAVEFEADIVDFGLTGIVVRPKNEHMLWETQRKFDTTRSNIRVRIWQDVKAVEL